MTTRKQHEQIVRMLEGSIARLYSKLSIHKAAGNKNAVADLVDRIIKLEKQLEEANKAKDKAFSKKKNN
jgi:hypothetical protein